MPTKELPFAIDAGVRPPYDYGHGMTARCAGKCRISFENRIKNPFEPI